MVGMQR